MQYLSRAGPSLLAIDLKPIHSFLSGLPLSLQPFHVGGLCFPPWHIQQLNDAWAKLVTCQVADSNA